nr:hypothetical protein DWF04_13590 [Cereibacter sphaeroides f. sp. denitrificans]
MPADRSGSRRPARSLRRCSDQGATPRGPVAFGPDPRRGGLPLCRVTSGGMAAASWLAARRIGAATSV